jgi:2-methylcitrate dehydratase PrpD
VVVTVAEELDASYPANRPARSTLVTARGRFTRTAIEALGSDQVPLDDAGLRAKFAMLTQPVLGASQHARLLDAVWSVEECVDVASIVALTVPERGR